jgi:hypothetical protein
MKDGEQKHDWMLLAYKGTSKERLQSSGCKHKSYNSYAR